MKNNKREILNQVLCQLHEVSDKLEEVINIDRREDVLKISEFKAINEISIYLAEIIIVIEKSDNRYEN